MAEQGTMDRGPAPGSWSVLRILTLLTVLLHWAAVLVFAWPNSPARDRIASFECPLPRLNTHAGEREIRIDPRDWEPAPVVMTYLAVTAQGQRWMMFTNTRWSGSSDRTARPAASRIDLRVVHTDGVKETFRVADPDRWWAPRWIRWRIMEWSLLGQRQYIPEAAKALARRFSSRPVLAVEVQRVFHRVPVLEPDERGSPLFESAAAYRASLDDRRVIQRQHFGPYGVPDGEGS